MTRYPYYIVSYFTGGILKKLFNDKKFNTYEDAWEALWKKMMRLDDVMKKNFFEKNQVMIVKYEDLYTSKIVSIYDNGDRIDIKKEEV